MQNCLLLFSVEFSDKNYLIAFKLSIFYNLTPSQKKKKCLSPKMFHFGLKDLRSFVDYSLNKNFIEIFGPLPIFEKGVGGDIFRQLCKISPIYTRPLT